MANGGAGGHNGTGTLDFDFNGAFEVCVQEDTNYVQSGGLWFNNNPFHFSLPVTLIQIFLFIVASRLIFFVLRPLRTPRFVCSLLAGILMGPSALGQIKTFRELMYPRRQAEILFITSSMGIVYSIFIVALKMDARMNLKSVRRTWRFGLIPFLANFWVMSGLFYLFSLEAFASHSPGDDNRRTVRLMLVVSASTTSFPVISESLLELNLITSELGQIALSSSMLNEIMHWIIIAVSTILQNRNTKYTLEFACSYIVFILFCLFIIRPVSLMIARNTPPGKPVKEGYVVMIQLGALVAALLSDVLGLSFLQGPLIMGLVMPSGPPLATTVVERTEVIISHFLLPLFFFCIGVKIDVLAIDEWGMILKIQLVILAGFLAKIVVCMLISISYQMRLKHGLVLGLMLNLKGIVDLIILSRLRRLQMMDDQMFAHLVLSVLAVTALVSPLIEILYNPRSRLEKTSKLSRKMMKTIQSIPRNSEFSVISCVHKEGEVRSVIALLEAFNPSHANPMCVYVIHLVELQGQSAHILRRIDINKKKSGVLNYPNTNHIMRAFDNFSHNSASAVSVVPCINVAPYKTMHDSICHLARDRSVPLIILPFHQNDHSHDNRVAAFVRDINSNFQDYAPCTVGILVDKHARLGLSTIPFLSFHVAIFFTGGADDREALALAMRMSERDDTTIVLFRFVVQKEKSEDRTEEGECKYHNNEEEEEEERTLDEGIMDEFRAMKFGNGRVALEEIVVAGWEKVFDGIRRCEGNYDLVIVGRKHKIGCFNDEEMSNFIENAEMLGMFGDMLVSTEFCNGMVPTLVVQCGGKRVMSSENDREASEAVSHAPSFGGRIYT